MNANVHPGREPFGRFFLPGPTEVRPEVLAAQSRAMIGHRGAGIQTLMEELQDGLREVFHTERPVFVSSSSATGLMEGAVLNGAQKRVLSLVNGAFSARFADIARACGREVTEVSVPWGEVVTPAALQEALTDGEYDAVTVVHSETSTGALSDIEALARVVHEKSEAVFLVDSVTGVGGAEMRADAWGLDFVLTGSQKALALPPGVAFGVASQRMMDRSASLEDKGYYFDFAAFEKNVQKFQTPTTPALSTLYALQVQLGHIRSETMEGRWARHLAMAERTWSWVEEMRASGVALEILAPEGARSPTVTAIALPEGTAGPDVVAAMLSRGFVVGGGYGKLKPTSFRIGHMGDHTVDELETLLGELTEVLR